MSERTIGLCVGAALPWVTGSVGAAVGAIHDGSSVMTAISDEAAMLARIPSPDEMVGRTVHERVRAALRAAVVDGTLPPALHLRQTEIARSLRVSVTPVREALRDLAGEGLVQLDAHRGAVVSSIEIGEFMEIRMLLDALWPLLARLAAERVTEPEIAMMWDLQRRMEADPSSYLPLNARFHDAISAAARSPRITGMAAMLRVATDRVLTTALHSAAPHRLHEGIEEHRAILAALEAHDSEAAVAAVMAHQTPTWDAVEATIRTAEAPEAGTAGAVGGTP